MLAEEVADVTARAMEKAPGKRPRIGRDNGSQFAAQEWREVVRHFELHEIPLRARHPESNGRLERYHRSVREEGLAEEDLQDLYHARELSAAWVRHYNQERLHSALNYLRPVDDYRGNPDALLEERARKLREARARRMKLNRTGSTGNDRGVP